MSRLLDETSKSFDNPFENDLIALSGIIMSLAVFTIVRPLFIGSVKVVIPASIVLVLADLTISIELGLGKPVDEIVYPWVVPLILILVALFFVVVLVKTVQFQKEAKSNRIPSHYKRDVSEKKD